MFFMGHNFAPGLFCAKNIFKIEKSKNLKNFIPKTKVFLGLYVKWCDAPIRGPAD